MIYHSAGGPVGVIHYYYAFQRACVQVGKHMAGRHRGHQQVFRIELRLVACSGVVSGQVQLRLAVDVYRVAAVVCPKAAGA